MEDSRFEYLSMSLKSALSLSPFLRTTQPGQPRGEVDRHPAAQRKAPHRYRSFHRRELSIHGRRMYYSLQFVRRSDAEAVARESIEKSARSMQADGNHLVRFER